MAMSAIEGRVSVNETLFREANDRIQRLYEARGSLGDENEFVCECGSRSCTETIRMTLAEYKAVRQSGRFVVAFGHVAPEKVAAMGTRTYSWKAPQRMVDVHSEEQLQALRGRSRADRNGAVYLRTQTQTQRVRAMARELVSRRETSRAGVGLPAETLSLRVESARR
jgi:hypothetical protein